MCKCVCVRLSVCLPLCVFVFVQHSVSNCLPQVGQTASFKYSATSCPNIRNTYGGNVSLSLCLSLPSFSLCLSPSVFLSHVMYTYAHIVTCTFTIYFFFHVHFAFACIRLHVFFIIYFAVNVQRYFLHVFRSFTCNA